LEGSWNLAIKGDEFSNFTGNIVLNNAMNNITKNYNVKLVTTNANNITYQASNQILKIKGTGDLTLDDETTRVQLLIVLYKNENIYVVFASKTNENLFDNFLIHGDIMQRKFEY
jgi:lipopolysaccharide export system protein LptA